MTSPDTTSTGIREPTGTHDSVAVVTAFLDAMGRLDADAALALMADDAVYHNVSLPKARGKEAVTKQIRTITKYLTGFEAVNHRIVGDGGTVLTERTDVIEIGPFRSEFWVCGTFEVRDGKVALWRDYFDWGNVLKGSAVGAGKAALRLVRALRRS